MRTLAQYRLSRKCMHRYAEYRKLKLRCVVPCSERASEIVESHHEYIKEIGCEITDSYAGVGGADASSPVLLFESKTIRSLLYESRVPLAVTRLTVYRQLHISSTDFLIFLKIF